MTSPKPHSKYVLTFPKDEKGDDIKFRFMLSLNKQISQVEKALIKAVGTLDGIDGIATGMGRYTIEITIARTFDPDEVIAELKHRLESEVLSDIILPQDKALIVP